MGDGQETSVANPALLEFLGTEGATQQMATRLEQEIEKATGGAGRICLNRTWEQEEGCEGSINEGKMLTNLAKDYRIKGVSAVREFFNLDTAVDADLIHALRKYGDAVSQALVTSAIHGPTDGITSVSYGIKKSENPDFAFASVDVCTPDQGRKSDL